MSVTFAAPGTFTRPELPDDRAALLDELLDMMAERTPGRLTSAGGKFHCPSPDHNDAKPSCDVSLRDGVWRWRCWGCGERGTAIDLLLLTGEARDVGEAFAILRRRTGRDHRDAAPLRRQAPKPKPAPVSHEPPPEVAGPAEAIDQLLAARRWPHEVVAGWNLRPVLDPWRRPRILFPVTLDGVEVWHKDRAVGDAMPKWLAPPGPIPAPLGADRLAHVVDGQAVFITEGETDAVALTAGWPDRAGDLPVVACPGVSGWQGRWSPAFAGLVVYVIADNDDAGRKFRQELGAGIEVAGATVRHVLVPDAYGDLGDWFAADPAAFPRSFVAAMAAADIEAQQSTEERAA